MTSGAAFLSQEELGQRIHTSCAEAYQAEVSRQSITGVPYEENTYWQGIETKVLRILQDKMIEIAQFQQEFAVAFSQAKREAYAEVKRFDPDPDHSLVSKNWKFAAIVAGAIAITAIVTIATVVPVTTFLI